MRLYSDRIDPNNFDLIIKSCRAECLRDYTESRTQFKYGGKKILPFGNNQNHGRDDNLLLLLGRDFFFFLFRQRKKMADNDNLKKKKKLFYHHTHMDGWSRNDFLNSTVRFSNFELIKNTKLNSNPILSLCVNREVLRYHPRRCHCQSRWISPPASKSWNTRHPDVLKNVDAASNNRHHVKSFKWIIRPFFLDRTR